MAMSTVAVCRVISNFLSLFSQQHLINDAKPAHLRLQQKQTVH